MFEIIEYNLIQFVELIPTIIALWFLFDMIGSLIFGKSN